MEPSTSAGIQKLKRNVCQANKNNGIFGTVYLIIRQGFSPVPDG